MPAPHPIVKRLRKLLPKDALVATPHGLRAYECDGLSAYRQPPLAVALPRSVAEVQAILRVCRELRVPVVSRGAGTSLSGGALPHADGIVLSTARMNQILDIDSANRVARVQAGVRNLAISEAVAAYGLFYAPDPSSQLACTIGGNVAENAGGVHCLKYGLTVHNVTGLKFVTIDGEIITLGGAALDAPGFDLLALLIGSEGMLGVVVEVSVRLLPKPQCTQVLLGAFASVAAAADSVTGIIAAGIIPAAVEMMDNFSIRACEDFVHAGYPTDAEAILLCELDGGSADVDAAVAAVQQIFTKHGATDTQLAESEATRALLWSGRKGAFPALGRISPDYYCIDGSIGRRHLSRVLEGIGKLSAHYGLRVANVFHAGDGNLHPLILYDAARPGELQKTEELGEKILELCIQVGGTITGEHGVGIEKLGGMCAQFNDHERAQFHAVREAFDPERLLNPGKAIPTLARCAEHNAMHVHRGQLPFPHLERL